MLVLTRKSKQQIRIGDNVVVTILKVKGQAVRVGIDAPQSVRVVRAELPLFDDAALGETTTSIEIAPGKTVSTGTSDETYQAPSGQPRSLPTLRRGLGDRLAARHQRLQGDADSPRGSSEGRFEAELGYCLRS